MTNMSCVKIADVGRNILRKRKMPKEHGTGGPTMTILIKGMEMPMVCDDCWALDEYGDYPRCRITEEQRGYNFRIREQRMEHCPLNEVPTPHGRLKDEKWIKEYITDTIKGFEEMDRSDLQNYSLIAGLRTVEVMIENAPTVIEGEPK